MSHISSSLDSLVAKNQQSTALTQTATSSVAQTESSGSGFGSAVNLTLSPAAQAAIASQSSSSGASSPSGAPPAGGSPPIPISTSSTSTDAELLIEEAKQQVIPKVGISGADEVVDDQGNIDEVKLSELIAQQLTAGPVNITA